MDAAYTDSWHRGADDEPCPIPGPSEEVSL